MFDFDNVGWGDEFFDVVDDYAVVGILTDGADVEDVLTAVNEGPFEHKGNDLKIVGVDDGGADTTDGTTGLDTKDGGADKT